MKQKVLKYFMSGTDDEVQFGDMIEVTLSKEEEDGSKLHHHMEVKFIDDPEAIDDLIDMGIIEEREIETDIIDFGEEDSDSFDEFRESVACDIEELSDRISALTLKVKLLEDKMDKLGETKKESSKKK